jgi:hypothetical protein
MGKKKWCFGRRDVICLTKDCPYMRGCIERVAEDRFDEFVKLAAEYPHQKLTQLHRVGRRCSKAAGIKA